MLMVSKTEMEKQRNNFQLKFGLLFYSEEIQNILGDLML